MLKELSLLLVATVLSTALLAPPSRWSYAHSSLLCSWQSDLDDILNVDVPCDTRKELIKGLQSKSQEIRKDVKEAVRDRNIEKLAPRDMKYGKDIRGLRAFNQQLRNDILPDIVSKGIPTLLSEGPNFVSELLKQSGGSGSLVKQAQSAVERIQEMSEDPSALQYTLDEVRRELKNIVKSTPEGLDSPAYEVLRKTDNYEIREYSAYAVASTRIDSNEETSEELMASGKGFNKLARYILEGENVEGEKMSMTTPVITDRDTMTFVLPQGRSADQAPTPNNADIAVVNVPKQIVAVREFTGLVTEKEKAKQRTVLEDALVRDGVGFDNLSFKTLQYNPPYTLPWVRRNEVLLAVTSKIEIAKDYDVDPTVEEEKEKEKEKEEEA